MMSRLALSLAFVCSLATVSLLSKQVNAGNDLQFGTVTYKTARIVVPRDYDSVIESFKASLSTFNIAKAYALYDAGATREQFIQGGRKSNPKGLPYVVYEIRWELPIFVDTGERMQVHRFGLGIGGSKSGRKLVGKYPAGGLHLPVDINIFADGEQRTVVDVLLPSGKYAASFSEEPGYQELARESDERWLAFLKSALDM